MTVKCKPTQPEIIRCKDCEHYFTKGALWRCMQCALPRSPEDYCSRAERRKDGGKGNQNSV